MSDKIKNITSDIMDQIHQGKIRMKSRVYFIIGSILTFVGVVFTTVFATFLIGLIRFFVRTNGPFFEYKIEKMIVNFPWWTASIAILCLIAGIWLIKQYDFSYKAHFWVVILCFTFIVLIAGLVIDLIGVNEVLLEHGPIQRVLCGYYPKELIEIDEYSHGSSSTVILEMKGQKSRPCQNMQK